MAFYLKCQIYVTDLLLRNFNTYIKSQIIQNYGYNSQNYIDIK